MKVLVVNEGTAGSVIDHILQSDSTSIANNLQEAEVIFADKLMFPCEETEIPTINTCTGAKGLVLDAIGRQKLIEILALSKDQPTKSLVYGLTCKGVMSDLVEISHTTRLMNDEIGPNVGMTTAIATKVDVSLDDAIPQYKAIKKLLTDIGYSGEFAIGIADNFSATEFNLGHSNNFFPLFSEVCKHKVIEQIEFMSGRLEVCEIYDAISAACLISHHPYPLVINVSNPKFRVPQTAEKHLWRTQYGPAEYALVTTHGRVFTEARHRLYRTMHNIVQFSPSVQFRTDLGLYVSFVLCKDKYDKMKVFESKEAHPPTQ